MIEAFIDESGTHWGSPTMSVAAYLFEEEQYWLLAKAWSDVLNEHSLPYFHMVDCAHRRGIFEGRSEDECDQVARRLIGIIKLRIRCGIMCSIAERDFVEERPEDWDISSYTTIVQWLVHGVSLWAKEYSVTEDIMYVLESGHAKSSEAHKAFRSLSMRKKMREMAKYAGHTFAVKDHRRLGYGLQAADILAWEWNKDFIDERLGRPRGRRKSLDSLLEKPHKFAHLHKEHLRNMFAMRHDLLTQINEGLFD